MTTAPGSGTRVAGGDALALLLREQREALRDGRLDSLSRLVPRLERAIAQMPSTLDPAALGRLRAEAARNAVLLRAALSGLDRVRSVAGTVQPLNTYGANGRVKAPAGPGRTLSRG